MQPVQYAKFFIPQSPHKSILPSGCYAKNPNILKQFGRLLLAVPLDHIDYQIDIINNVSKVSLTQTYTNKLSQILELQYCFPIDHRIAVIGFKAKFGDNQIVGVVKEKQQAKQEYAEAKAKGQQVVLGEIDKHQSDVMRLQIGNLKPGEVLTLDIVFMTELQVSMNQFWKLQIPSTVSPRYANEKFFDAKNSAMDVEGMGISKWSFKITLSSSEPLTYTRAISHELLLLSQNENKTEMVFVMEESCIPNKDFTFLYSTADISKPAYVLGATDVSMSAVVSFIPKYNSLPLQDAYKMQLTNKGFEVDPQSAPAEYIFLLDRSGSMSGKRIQNAKEALILFLKSLPQDCYFQIFSFGTSFKQLFPSSLKYQDSSLKRAIDNIKTFKADMMGTEIYQPLQAIFSQPTIKGYPKQIFLLTDGEVDNIPRILKLIKRNIKNSRVHSIGIGDGASVELIMGAAQKGKGSHVFIRDSDNINAKIIELLDLAISPIITQFQLRYDASIVSAIIPNPQEIPFILKNEPATFYIMFKDEFPADTAIGLEYVQSITKKKHTSEIKLHLDKSQGKDFVDKMAHHRALSVLCESIDENQSSCNDILMSKVSDLKSYTISESVKHQVLCPLTAYLCVGKTLRDNQSAEFKSISSVAISQMAVPEEIEKDKKPSFVGSPQLFGASQNSYGSSSLFSSSPHKTINRSVVPSSASLSPNTGGLFGNSSTSQQPIGGLFGMGGPPQQKGGFFGTSSFSQTAAGGLFGMSQPQQSSLFGATSTTTSTNSFFLPPPPAMSPPPPPGSAIPPPPSLFGASLPPPTPPPLISSTATNHLLSQISDPISRLRKAPVNDNPPQEKKTSIVKSFMNLFGASKSPSQSSANKIPQPSPPPAPHQPIFLQNQSQLNLQSFVSSAPMKKEQQNFLDCLREADVVDSNMDIAFEMLPNFQKINKLDVFEQQIVSKAGKGDVKVLVTAQKADGSWSDYNMVLNVLGTSSNSITSIIQKIKNQDLVLTVLAVTWLQKYHATAEYKMLIRKARSWIKKTRESMGVQETQIQEIQSLVI